MVHYTPVIFLPGVVRAIVDAGRPGTYVLGTGSDFEAGYVGRSDTCVRSRLASHNHLYRFDYFIQSTHAPPQRRTCSNATRTMLLNSVVRPS